MQARPGSVGGGQIVRVALALHPGSPDAAGVVLGGFGKTKIQMLLVPLRKLLHLRRQHVDVIDALDAGAAVQIEALQQPGMFDRFVVEGDRKPERIFEAQEARPIAFRFATIGQAFGFCDGGDFIERRFRSSFVSQLFDAWHGTEFQLQAPFPILDTAQVERSIVFMDHVEAEQVHVKVARSGAISATERTTWPTRITRGKVMIFQSPFSKFRNRMRRERHRNVL